MKISPRNQAGQQASVIILTVFGFAVAALTLATFFYLTQSQANTVARSQTWAKSMTLAEAGLEEGLSLINKCSGRFNASSNWWDTAVSADGWDTTTACPFTNWPVAGGTIYHMQRRLIATNEDFYDCWVYNTTNASITGPTIYSTGSAKWKLTTYLYASPTVTRNILVKTQAAALLRGALVALTTIDFKGNSVTIDSFDSADPLHSDWQTNWSYRGSFYGTYPLLDAMTFNADGSYKRNANGDIFTDAAIVNIDQADVYGHVYTAPGGSVSIGNNGSIGDVPWVNSSTYGIEPGWWRDDFNTTFPDVLLPDTTSWTDKGNGNSAITINAPGNYKVSGTQNKSVTINATNVVIYFPSGIKFTGNSTLTINPNADLTLYTGGNLDFGNTLFNNITQFALNCSIFALPTCTSISMGGTGISFGYFYAPEASLTMNGGGNNSSGVVGGFVVHDITFTGHFNLHYDEALGRSGPKRAFIPTCWQEVY